MPFKNVPPTLRLKHRFQGEPMLPARTANLARYWFAVRAGKIGSPVSNLS